MTPEQHIRSLLKGWGQFPAESEEDFACLVEEVSTALRMGAEPPALVFVIQNEFFNHFGEEGPADPVVAIAEQLCAWWTSQGA